MYNRTLLFFLGAASLLAFIGSATAGQVWSKRINGPGSGSDSALVMSIDASNNVFAAGRVAGANPASTSDYGVVKLSKTGTTLWTNYYNGPGDYNDTAWGIVSDASGNVYVTGRSRGTSSIDDFATIKYSSSGLPLWTNRARFSGTSGADAIGLDKSNNVFVAGWSGSGGQLLKYSSAGVPLWTNTYTSASSSSQGFYLLGVDSVGNVVCGGGEMITGHSNDVVAIKYSNAGVPLWTNRFNGTGNGDDFVYGIVIDSNNDAIFTGSSYGTSGVLEILTIKYSSSGVPLWTNRYPSTPYRDLLGGFGIAVDQNNNVVVTGTSPRDTHYSEMVTLKYTSQGLPVWTNRFSTPYGTAGSAVAIDTAGNVFVTGLTNVDSIYYNCMTVAYSSSGQQRWLNKYATVPNTDGGNAISLDSSGNVYICGSSSNDLMVVKYTGLQSVPVQTQKTNNSLVVTWDNSTFQLQSAPSPSGAFTDVVGATSPYTNAISPNPQFFRLKGQ